MSTTTNMPNRYRNAVIAHVMIDGAAAAIDFYRQAFGATQLLRADHPDGRILHAEIAIGGSLLMLGDADPPFADPVSLGGCAVGLHVYVADVDALFARAVDAGAKPLDEPQDMFYGDRQAMLRDPFGHVWVLLQRLEDVPPDEIERRGAAMVAGRTS